MYFIEDWLHTIYSDWVVSLSNERGDTTETAIVVRSCLQQRELVSFGEQASSPHEFAAWFEPKGRLTGCALDDEWWIRAGPLFQTPPEPEKLVAGTRDGYLEASTGEFAIRARHGVRHMIVVGRGPDPIKVFTANLDAGLSNADLGEFDLSDSYPVESQ